GNQAEGHDAEDAVQRDAGSQVAGYGARGTEESGGEDAEDGNRQDDQQQVLKRLAQAAGEHDGNHYPAEQGGDTEKAEVIAALGVDGEGSLPEVQEQAGAGQAKQELAAVPVTRERLTVHHGGAEVKQAGQKTRYWSDHGRESRTIAAGTVEPRRPIKGPDPLIPTSKPNQRARPFDPAREAKSKGLTL